MIDATKGKRLAVSDSMGTMMNTLRNFSLHPEFNLLENVFCQ